MLHSDKLVLVTTKTDLRNASSIIYIQGQSVTFRVSDSSATQIDWVVVLRPTRHKIGHFGDVLPSQFLSLLSLVLKNWNKHNKSKPASVTKYTTTLYYNIKLTPKKQHSVVSYDILPGNGEGPFWFHRFINLSLTYLNTYPLNLQPRDPHRIKWSTCEKSRQITKNTKIPSEH